MMDSDRGVSELSGPLDLDLEIEKEIEDVEFSSWKWVKIDEQNDHIPFRTTRITVWSICTHPTNHNPH